MTLAEFSQGPGGGLVIENVDCPMPIEEIVCGVFDNPKDLVQHLLTAHQDWEVAVLAARLTIEANALQERIMTFTNLAQQDEVAETWYPTRMDGEYTAGVEKPEGIDGSAPGKRAQS